MKPAVLLLAALLLSSCVPSDVAIGTKTTLPNGMSETHESLGNGKYLLTIYDTRSGVGYLADSYQSMTLAANRWAARRFPNGFHVDEGAGLNMGTRAPFTVPNKTFVITGRE